MQHLAREQAQQFNPRWPVNSLAWELTTQCPPIVKESLAVLGLLLCLQAHHINLPSQAAHLYPEVNMEVPRILDASGFSFAPADARKGKDYYAGINPALTAVGAALEGVQQPLQEYLDKQDNNAFLQGQADHMAGTVREQSWLTKDAYNQGIKFGKFGESQLQFSAKAKTLAQQSIEAGEDVQTYTSKLAPLLKEQSDFMDSLGLQSDARDKANQSILNNVNVAQKLYQSELEATTIRNVNTATNSITAGAVNTINAAMITRSWLPNRRQLLHLPRLRWNWQIWVVRL